MDPIATSSSSPSNKYEYRVSNCRNGYIWNREYFFTIWNINLIYQLGVTHTPIRISVFVESRTVQVSSSSTIQNLVTKINTNWHKSPVYWGVNGGQPSSTSKNPPPSPSPSPSPPSSSTASKRPPCVIFNTWRRLIYLIAYTVVWIYDAPWAPSFLSESNRCWRYTEREKNWSGWNFTTAQTRFPFKEVVNCGGCWSVHFSASWKKYLPLYRNGSF